MHNTIIHNLLLLLEYGAFSSFPKEESLCYMSPYKWRILVDAADKLKVLPYVAAGAEQLKGNDILVPALYEALSDPHRSLATDTYAVGEVHMFNHWTEKRLEELKEEEMNSRDTSDETLMLLDLIVRNVISMIQRDIDIDGIIAVGLYMRNNKEKIDYEKLGKWLSRIGLVKMASLIGNILLQGFHLQSDEIPIAIEVQKDAYCILINRIENAFEKHSFPNASRFNYAFQETISHKFMSAISLVTDIEE